MFHPPLFSLVINVLRPAPVLPLVIHSREIGARILGITIVIHSIDRIMRAAGLIDSILTSYILVDVDEVVESM